MCVYRIRRRGGMMKKKEIDKQNIYIKSQVSADTLERDGRFFLLLNYTHVLNATDFQ